VNVPVIDALNSYLDSEIDYAKDSAAEARGRKNAYKQMKNYLASMCGECGEYFYSDDKLRDHKEIHHEAVITS